MLRSVRRVAPIFVCGLISAFSPITVSADDLHATRASGNTNPTADDTVHLAAYEGYTGDIDAFFAALRHRESSSNYRAVNTLNFIGAYQFGEAALIDLGYVRRDRDIYDNDFGGGFTGKHGIRSVRDFLNNPAVQDRAAKDWMQIMWRYIRADGLDRYAWKEVGGVTLSPSGMLAATHLLGSGGLRQFIESKGSADIRDPYGMPLRSYIVDLGGYDIPFAPPSPIAS